MNKQLKKMIHQSIKITAIASVTLVLAACAHKRQDQSAINDANAAYNGSAQSSGLGEESTFGDQAGGSRSSLSRRVYYFDFDSNIIHDADKPAIMANANYLVAHPNTHVIVEGHTDPRGSREYNVALGERRAKAVAELMKSKGVNASQIRVISYGAEKLAVPGHTEDDFQQDRRVVLVYLQQ